jgi:hypothetical protein
LSRDLGVVHPRRWFGLNETRFHRVRITQSGIANRARQRRPSVWVFVPADVRTADTYNRRAGGHTSNQHAKTFEDEDDDEDEDDYRGDTLNGSKPARSSS